MKRSVELEVDDLGQVTWPEGRLELSPKVAAAITALPAQTLIRLEGEYARPNAATKILTIGKLPVTIARPVERALRARPDELARFRDAIERDRSGVGRALCGVLAVRERRLDDARTYVREALQAGVPAAASAPFAAAWAAAQPVELARELEDALLATIWQDIHAWPAWIDPVVADAHAAVVPRDRVRPPWHFGGPRVAHDQGLVVGWLLAQVERIATPVEGVGTRELRAMTDAQRRAWLRGSEARDESAHAAAYRAAVRRHPADSQDSPPDDVDPGPLERDQPLLAWLRFLAGNPPGDARGLATDLVRALRVLEPRAARAVALALDAVVILSALAPELARDVEQVVLVRSAMRDGFAIVRVAEDRIAMIRAPRGAFGDWQLIAGKTAALAAVPELFARAAAAAVANRDPLACEIVVDPVAPRPPRVKPSPPEAKPEPPRERFVQHATFGRGRVIERLGDGTDVKLVIEFDGAGRKILLERFVTPE